MEDYRLLGCNAVQSDALQMAAVESSAVKFLPDHKTSHSSRQQSSLTNLQSLTSSMFTEEQLYTVYPTTTIGPWNPVLLIHTATVNNKILICKTDFSGLGNIRHLPPHLAIFISNYLNWFSSQREWQLRQHSCHYLSITFVYRQFLFAIWKATRGQWPTVVLFLSATKIIGEVEQISSLTLPLAFSFTVLYFFFWHKNTDRNKMFILQRETSRLTRRNYTRTMGTCS